MLMICIPMMMRLMVTGDTGSVATIRSIGDGSHVPFFEHSALSALELLQTESAREGVIERSIDFVEIPIFIQYIQDPLQ